MAGVKISDLPQNADPQPVDLFPQVAGGITEQHEIGQWVSYTGQGWWADVITPLVIPVQPVYVGTPTPDGSFVDEGVSGFSFAPDTINGVPVAAATSLREQIVVLETKVRITSTTNSVRQLYVAEMRDEGGGWVVATFGGHVYRFNGLGDYELLLLAVARTMRTGWKLTLMYSANGSGLQINQVSFVDPNGLAHNEPGVTAGIARYAPYQFGITGGV